MRNRAARASELNLRSMMASKETRGAQAILCDIFPDGKAEGHRLANLPPSSRHFRPAPKKFLDRREDWPPPRPDAENFCGEVSFPLSRRLTRSPRRRVREASPALRGPAPLQS